MKIHRGRTWVRAILACMLVAGFAPSAAADEWMLMGREGGCYSIERLADRREELRGITTPDEFAERMSAEGEEVRRQEITAEDGSLAAVQIDVPGRGLGLVFASPAVCR